MMSAFFFILCEGLFLIHTIGAFGKICQYIYGNQLKFLLFF